MTSYTRLTIFSIHKRLAPVLWVLMVVMSCASASAQEGAAASTSNSLGETMSVAELQQQVLAWANDSGDFGSASQRIELAAGKMDTRLSFSRCREPLLFEQQQNAARANRTLVKVRCNDQQQPWAIFVPLTVHRFQPVVVASQTLLRNTAVSASQLEIREVALTAATQQWFDSVDEIDGMIARRTVQSGQPLTQYDLKKPRLVKKGDEVVIVADTGNISVKMRGTALGDGYRDQQIRVRNASSKRTIKAVVTDTGRVRALM